MSNEHNPNYSVAPPTGAFGPEQGVDPNFINRWPSKFVLPQGPSGSFSMAGWTEGNEGFIQQTFLGASIRGFNVSAGFGNSSSNLSVDLVEDEYNNSDSSFLGLGDDVYHSGKGDKFVAPPVGTPVFFKFGKNWATVEQAYRRTVEETYNITKDDGIVISQKEWEFERDATDDFTANIAEEYNYKKDKGYDIRESGMFAMFPYEASGDLPNKRQKYYLREGGYIKDADPGHSPAPEDPRDDRRYYVDKSFLYEHDNRDRGFEHFAFGGILQSVVESRSANGNPTYSVQVTDPREILSNCVLLLNDYSGTTYNNKNLFNVYGFLEYDPSDELLDKLNEKSLYKWILKKNVDSNGLTRYVGEDESKNLEILQEVLVDGTVKSTQINPSFDYWDVYNFPDARQRSGNDLVYDAEAIDYLDHLFATEVYPKFFPITGEGFSRRSEQGIPWYRVSQGLAALFENYGKLPEEYRNAGFGGTIDFRGFNYIVDFGGIPVEKIPKNYFLDYDKIDLLSLSMELCDIISHDLLVTLLPVIDPLTNLNKGAYEEKAAIMNSAFAKNSYWTKKAHQYEPFSPDYNKAMNNIIHGIIRLDAIDRSKQPSYGSIQSYINRLEARGINVENRDLGFELSNVTTDKFVAGAQQVDMHYFTTSKDRDSLEYRKKIAGVENSFNLLNEKQWSLETSMKQQVLPFYGFLGKKALSIPRGFGPYQQIMLDSSSLDAHGVGNYYVATEMELRAAAVSYENWAKFLLGYNETYIEELTEYSTFYRELGRTTDKEIIGLNNLDQEEIRNSGISIDKLKNRDFGVSVPRCVFNSERDFMGKDGYPASPCSPPYGYPLYYKRAERIGIPQAGSAQVANDLLKVMTEIEKIKSFTRGDTSSQLVALNKKLDEHLERINQSKPNATGRVKFAKTEVVRNADGGLTAKPAEEADSCIVEEVRKLEETIKNYREAGKEVVQLESILENNAALIKNMNKTSRRSEENARKVHAFLQKIANDNLGKKFLVKIPQNTNVNYQDRISLRKYFGQVGEEEVDGDIVPIYGDMTQNIKSIYQGPFGFKPEPISSGASILEDQKYLFELNRIKSDLLNIKSWDYERYLYRDSFEGGLSPDLTYSYGALKGNYNPINEKWAFNYKPEPQGGFFNFALYSRNLSFSQIERHSEPIVKRPKLALGIQQQLIPKDLTNFVSENGRIFCYVRYDNSQYLDLTEIPKDSFTQEILVNNISVPDILEDLENVNPEAKATKDRVNDRLSGEDKRPNTIAFVKCEVDEQLYMPPKSGEFNNLVYGREVEFVLNFEEFDVIESTDSDGCPAFTCVRPHAQPIFKLWDDFRTTSLDAGTEFVDPEKLKLFNLDLTTNLFTQEEKQFNYGRLDRVIGGGGSDGTVVKSHDHVRIYKKSEEEDEKDTFIIDTEEENLDNNHVYALITIPGRVKPTEDQRYIDTHKHNINGAKLKHILTQDVVRGPKGFEKPAEIINEKVPLNCNEFNFNQLQSAQKLQQQVKNTATLAVPEIQLAYTKDSPVYPNIVALPLMSTERCYGPWRSAAQIDETKDRYSDIGGKIEFVKDENLAPWNYAGYQLMNEAGKLQADFSNSLLLFSERGGFVFPAMPSGINLGKSLLESGPLVTSISTNVSQGGVKTTVKMDLYTSRFGKLQKQKEEAISQIVRERQKIIDNNNKMIRRGLIKNSLSSNLGGDIKTAGSAITNMSEALTDLEKSKKPLDSIIFSVASQDKTYQSIETDKDVTISKSYSQASVQSHDQVLQTISNMDNKNTSMIAYNNSAGGRITDNLSPYSNEDHPNMPSREYINRNAILNSGPLRKNDIP